MRTTLAEVLEQCAREEGASRLADRIGIDRSSLWRYRQGIAPSRLAMRAIAKALGVSPDDVAEWSREPSAGR